MLPDNTNTRKSVENILFRNLKSRLKRSFNDEILKEIERIQNESADLSFDHVISTIVDKLSQENAFKFNQYEFLEDLNVLLESEDTQFGNVFVGDNISDSLNGSYSSLNSSSIDFLSCEQLGSLFQTLLQSSAVEQLEALETLCRLSTLEHVTKQNVWREIHRTLLDLMLQSNVHFVKEGCLRVFVKMLSSHEPKVVNEGFHGLFDFFSTSLKSDKFKSQPDPLSDKFVCQIFILINRFLREITSHWLRYPHKIMNNIVKCSIQILDCDQLNVIILFFASFDIEAIWLRNFTYSSIGRSLLFNTVQDKIYIFESLVSECNQFYYNENFIYNECCKNRQISVAIHNVCFLSRFLKYDNGRSLFNTILKPNIWVNVIEIIMKCAWTLLNKICLKCARHIHISLSETFKSVWLCDNEEQIDVIVKVLDIIEAPMEVLMSANVSCLIALCLSEVMQCLPSASYVINDKKIMKILFPNSLKILESLNIESSDSLYIMQCNLFFASRILSIPTSLNTMISDKIITYQTILFRFLTKLFKMLNFDSSNVVRQNPYMIPFERVVKIYFIFLQNPRSLIACINANFLCESLNLLLKCVLKMYNYSYDSCLHYINNLATILSYSSAIHNVLNKEIIFEIQDVIWYQKLDCLSLSATEENILKNISTVLATNMNILDEFINDNITLSPFIQLFKYIFLYPKINDLYSSHDHIVFMLNVISILVYDVHMVCALQFRFEIQKLLMEYLSHNYLIENEFFIDEISIMLNYCILKLYSIGGPSEQILPRKYLIDNECDYSAVLTITYPPHYNWYNFPENDKMGSLSYIDILNSIQSDATPFIQQYMKHLKTEENIDITGINDFLLESLNYINIDLQFESEKNIHTNEILTKETLLGVHLTCAYGSTIGMLHENLNDESNLQELFIRCKNYFDLKDSVSFDVFVSTIFLIFHGDLEDTWRFLENFSQSSNSLFIWNQRGLLNYLLDDSEKNLTFILEHCNFIVMNSLPNVYSAFQICDSSPSVIFQYWISKCFWNYLDFNEICHFICLVVLSGEKYAIYYFVSILKHIQNEILYESQRQNLIFYLKEYHLKGYKLHYHMHYIESLSEKYNVN